MKYILLLILYFKLQFIYSQNILEGEYCNNVSYVSTCIKFYKDHTFEMGIYTCTDNSTGKGIYTYKNDKLKLKFNEPSHKKDSSDITIISSPLGFKEKPKANITCYTKDSTLIRKYSVSYYTKSQQKILQYYNHNENRENQFTIREIGQHTVDQICINGGLVYEDICIPVVDSCHSSITIFLAERENWNLKLDSKYNRTYKVNSVSEDTLFLRSRKRNKIVLSKSK